MFRVDGTVNGLNENITALASAGNNVISKTVALNSGKGYVEGEVIQAYLYSGLSNNVLIANGGLNYTNGDIAIFSGGSAGTSAAGYISTDGSGTVTSLTLTNPGSGYTDPPIVSVKSLHGNGAIIGVELSEYNTAAEVVGRVIKTGVGRARGFWTTTRSFLISDKYIQDSYYYQDYSYEIKVAETLDKYKNVLYNTFHSAGSELFGKYLSINSDVSPVAILSEQTSASIS
jgi:hypothetical protein